MAKAKKIKEDQLSTIVRHQKDLNTILTNIGILESQKHSMLHQLADINKTAEDFKSELQKEYGAVNISLEDGTYTLIEDSQLPEPE
jgi:hypothetical protein